MKIAIAIQSCAAYKNRRDAIRRTWLKDVPRGIDTFFFVGGDGVEDAVKLECKDDYESCANKQLEMIKNVKGYDYVFFCDDDTYIVPDRLFLSGFEQHDYMGCPCQIDGRGVMMAQGGAGFWLSKKAMNDGLKVYEKYPPISTHSDRFVGELMCGTVKLHGDFRFNLGKYNGNTGFCNLIPNLYNRYITTHFVTPQMMDTIHAHFKEGLPLPPNCYTMSIEGKRVDFSEKSGKWWYYIWGDTQFRGEFELAQYAEMDAYKRLMPCT